MLNEIVYHSSKIAAGHEKYLVRIDMSRDLKEIRRFSLNKLLRMIHLSLRLWRTVRKTRPDLIYFSFMPVGKGFLRDAWFFFLIKRHGKRILLHLNNRGIDRYRKRLLYRTLYPYIFNRSLVIHVSQRLMEQEILDQRLRPLRTFVVSNTVRPFTVRKGKNVRDPRPWLRFLFISNYLKEKGLGVLLEALRHLHDKGIGFRLDTYGSVHDPLVFRRYQEQVREGGLRSVVQLHGPVFGTEKERVLMDADLFIFPSFFQEECFPLVLLEAMQAGLPIVATSIGAVPEMVKNEQEALLVKPGDSIALAQALEKISLSAPLRYNLGENAKKRFEKEFSLPVFEKKMEHIFSVSLK